MARYFLLLTLILSLVTQGLLRSQEGGEEGGGHEAPSEPGHDHEPENPLPPAPPEPVVPIEPTEPVSPETPTVPPVPEEPVGPEVPVTPEIPVTGQEPQTPVDLINDYTSEVFAYSKETVMVNGKPQEVEWLHDTAFTENIASLLGMLDALAFPGHGEWVGQIIDLLNPQLSSVIKAIQSIDPSSITSETILDLQERNLGIFFEKGRDIPWYQAQLDNLMTNLDAYEGMDEATKEDLKTKIKDIQNQLTQLKIAAETKLDQLGIQRAKNFIGKAVAKIGSVVNEVLVSLGFKAPPTTMQSNTNILKQLTPPQLWNIIEKFINNVNLQGNLINLDAVFASLQSKMPVPETATSAEQTSRLQLLQTNLAVFKNAESELPKAKNALAVVRQHFNADPSYIDSLGNLIRENMYATKTMDQARRLVIADMLQSFSVDPSRAQNLVSTGKMSDFNIYDLLGIAVGSDINQITQAMDAQFKTLTSWTYNLTDMLNNGLTALPDDVTQPTGAAAQLLAKLRSQGKILTGQISQERSQIAEIINGYLVFISRMNNPTYKSAYDALLKNWAVLSSGDPDRVPGILLQIPGHELTSDQINNLTEGAKIISGSAKDYNDWSAQINKLSNVIPLLESSIAGWQKVPLTRS